MWVVGVDPGLRGGIAFIGVRKEAERPIVMLIEPMPLDWEGRIDVKALYRMVTRGHTYNPDLAVLERVSSAPGQGVASTFTLGQAAGVVEGVLGCCAHRVELVTPAAWKASYRLQGGKRGKAQSVSLAAKLVDRRMSEGCAEALLLAWWGWKWRC